MEWLYYLLAIMFVMSLIILSLNMYVSFDYVMNDEEHQLVIAVYISRIRLLRKRHDLTEINTLSLDSRIEQLIDFDIKQISKQMKLMYSLSREMLKRITFHRFDWQTKIGTGEASSTGMVIGGLWGIKSLFVSFLLHQCQFNCQPQMNILPQFQQKQMSMIVNCIVSIRIGKAISIFMKLISYMLKIIKQERKGA